ncbi:MAG: mitochondrial fission ELM1 family protein [Alphaproteobacteria bacterium]|nr:mitochondrial fission ELM1 family protein [Alphaproteobacteria bacterium]
MKNIFIACSLFLAMNSEAFAVKLYLLSNHGNAGDHNQLLGIQRALSKLSPEKIPFEDLDTKQTTSSEIKQKVEDDLQTQKVIVVGSGEGGIDGIEALEALPQNPQLITCLTSHMFLDRYTNLEKINFIALPIHDFTAMDKALGERLITTVGVAHNRNAKTAEKTYQEYKSELPQADAYLGVVLGGDAPVPPPVKDIKLFTTDDAKRIATYVIQQAKATNACVLVLNGPRTGKHTPDKQEIPTAHRNGHLDAVTAHFKEILLSQLPADKVKVFDFQFNEKPPYNAFDLALGAANATHSQIFIPAESTSMASEAIDTMPPNSVILYENSAMNEVHYAHMNSELNARRASILKDYKEIITPVADTGEAKSSASAVIAKKLWEAINL